MLKSIALNPTQIPTSCKMRSQVGEEGRNREGKTKAKARNSTKGMAPQTVPQPLWNLRHFQSPRLPGSCGLRQTLLTADFKIQTDSLADSLSTPAFGQHGTQEELFWPLRRHSRYFIISLKPWVRIFVSPCSAERNLSPTA